MCLHFFLFLHTSGFQMSKDLLIYKLSNLRNNACDPEWLTEGWRVLCCPWISEDWWSDNCFMKWLLWVGVRCTLSIIQELYQVWYAAPAGEGNLTLWIHDPLLSPFQKGDNFGVKKNYYWAQIRRTKYVCSNCKDGQGGLHQSCKFHDPWEGVICCAWAWPYKS